jgi:hypothetical protein
VTDDEPRKVRRAPRGLGAEGRALWRDVCADFDLRPDELRVLQHACATADLLAALQKEIGADLLVAGSMGQMRANPLLDQVHKHRLLLARLLGQLALPDDPADVGRGALAQARSVSARRAALARWSL